MSQGQWESILPGLSRWKSAHFGLQQPVNSYLWQKCDGAILIDPAVDLIPDSLGQLGVCRISGIFVTHFQEEHVAGSVHFPDIPVHVPAGDEYLAEGVDAYRKVVTPWQQPWDWETRGNFRGHLAGARNERPASRSLCLAERPLVPGETQSDLRILASPGHGKNAVSLIAEIAGIRVCFCGDLVCGEGQLWNWFDCEWDYGLHGGQQALVESVSRIKGEHLEILCPSHGDLIREPDRVLALLENRLSALLESTPSEGDGPINFAEKDSRAKGFREILPNLHQYRDGNCAILVSQSGGALMVDDGLCFWKPQLERDEHHRAVISEIKRALEVSRIEIVIPTHYHGDHLENIPAVVQLEDAEVVALDLVSEPIEHPERFNLACPLPWYGTTADNISISRKLPDRGHLAYREFDLEIFHLGGQTHYSLGIDVTIEGVRTLFVGDALDYRSPLCEPILCYNKAEPITSGWLFALERMIERQPDLIVCGHGSAIRDPMPLLLKKQSAWRKRMQEFKILSFRADLSEFFDPFFAPCSWCDDARGAHA